MTDVLTQIQDELNNLLTQMSSTLATIRHRAPPAPIPGQPLLTSFAEHEAQQAANNAAENPTNGNDPNQPAPELPPLPVSKEELESQIRELSADLVAKEQQLEVLIKALPGRGVSEREQEERMRVLERELEDVERERKEVMGERERLLDEVERVILRAAGVRR